jgi:alkylation response protein AidB-like acyl-CoA dehydrogenase
VRFAFTTEQLSLRDTVRGLLKQECPPTQVRAAWSSGDGRVPGLWEKLQEIGALGLLAREEDGGLGLRDIDLVLLLEECGRFAVPDAFVDAAAVVVPLLRDLGDGTPRQWLRGIVSGKVRVAIGLGDAPLLLGATVADLLVMQSGQELHALDRASTELSPQRSIDGSRALSRVRWVPSAGTRIAEGEMARGALADARDRGAVASAAELLGLGRRMLEVTVEYTKTRQQFGKPIGSFQAIKHHLADALIAVEMAAPTVYRAAYSLATRAPDRSIHASMAKALASDTATLVARNALQCHGAIGYAFENDLQMWMKRVWARSADWGDAASHRARVARTILAEGGA